MPINKDIASIRREYTRNKFNETNANPNPFKQFKIWFDEAIAVGQIEPTAMTLSTADKNGIVTSRVVLLKHFDEEGFVFFTNYNSLKGRQIADNPNVSLLFFWDILERQVRIEGICQKTTQQESDEYFQTRPYLSRIGAWASKQSQPLKSRFTLMREVAQLVVKYPNYVPLPDFWGGYRVIPRLFEFWQGRENRLHDRIQYKKDGTIWQISRLYP